MDTKTFKRLICMNLCAILGVVFLAFTAACLLFIFILLIGLLAGEWSLLHLLAMIGITGGFATIAAVFTSLHTAMGGSLFRLRGDN